MDQQTRPHLCPASRASQPGAAPEQGRRRPARGRLQRQTFMQEVGKGSLGPRRARTWREEISAPEAARAATSATRKNQEQWCARGSAIRWQDSPWRPIGKRSDPAAAASRSQAKRTNLGTTPPPLARQVKWHWPGATKISQPFRAIAYRLTGDPGDAQHFSARAKGVPGGCPVRSGSKTSERADNSSSIHRSSRRRGAGDRQPMDAPTTARPSRQVRLSIPKSCAKPALAARVWCREHAGQNGSTTRRDRRCTASRA